MKEGAQAYEAQPSTVITEPKPDYQAPETNQPTETVVPVIEEKLNVSKKTMTENAKIIKEPMTETKTVEVPLTSEQLVIERRPASEQKLQMNSQLRQEQRSQYRYQGKK